MLASLARAFVLVTLPVVGSAEAAPPGGTMTAEARYHACMDQVGSDAGKALQTRRGLAEAGRRRRGAALRRRRRDGARPICASRRDTGRTGGATARGTTPVLRASLFAQAAHAWLAADMPDRAEVASTHALALAPGDAGVLVLRARARAGQRRFGEAIADLDQAIAVDPTSRRRLRLPGERAAAARSAGFRRRRPRPGALARSAASRGAARTRHRPRAEGRWRRRAGRLADADRRRTEDAGRGVGAPQPGAAGQGRVRRAATLTRPLSLAPSLAGEGSRAPATYSLSPRGRSGSEGPAGESKSPDRRRRRPAAGRGWRRRGWRGSSAET